MLSIVPISYPQGKAELPLKSASGRANLVEISSDQIPLQALSKLIGAKVVLPNSASDLISIYPEGEIVRVILNAPRAGRNLDHIPKAKLAELLNSDDLKYIIVLIKPKELQLASAETNGLFVLSKANKRSETGPIFEAIGYADEHIARTGGINLESLELLSGIAEKNTVGSNGSSSVVTGLEAHNSRANAARATVLTRNERDLSKSTRAEPPPQRIIAARIGPSDEDNSKPKIRERKKLSTQVKPSPTIERLTDVLFTGRDLDLIDELIIDKLGLFDTDGQRDEVIQAGKDSEDKSNRILHTVGKKHCIRNTLDGELDRNLEAWAQENKSDHAFARGVLGLFYESRRAQINKLAEVSRTLIPIRPTQPETPPPSPFQPRPSTATQVTLPAGPLSDKPKSFPVSPATLPVRRPEPAAGPTSQADDRPSITSILALIKDTSPILSTSDIGIGREKAERILNYLETTNKFQLAEEMRIDDGYVRVGFLRLGELRKNKSRLIFYYLGQNEDLVTTKSIGTLLFSATEEPDAFLSGGLGLNQKFLEEAEAAVCAGWLKKDKKNPDTLFGKRIKWQLDGRKGRPPAPPEQIQAKREQIYSIVVESLKSGKELEADETEIFKNYFEDKIKTDAQRTEIINLAKQENNKRNKIVYLLGKMNKIKNTLDGKPDESLNAWSSDEANWEHAFGRGVLGKWFKVSEKEEMAAALRMFRQARAAAHPPKGSAGGPQPAAIPTPAGARAKAIREKGNPIISDTDGKNAKIVIQYLTSRVPFPNGFDKKNIPDFGFREQDMVGLINAAVKGKRSNSFYIEAFWLGLNTSVREYMNRYISAYQEWLEANKTTHSFAKGYYKPRE